MTRAQGSGIESEAFGATADGRPVQRHRLVNARGSEAAFIDYGATLTELHMPDRQGGHADVVLGFDSVAEYEAPRTWFGCVVGRVANRTRGASFELGGRRHDLEANDGGHHLHGGSQGLSTRVWSPTGASDDTGPGLRFRCVSEDGEGGYPGRLEVEVVYRLTHDDRLRIEYEATIDRPAPVNLTHHAYFDLSGTGDVRAHSLEIASDRFVEVDAELIPTGRLLAASDTPFDFTRAKFVGQDLAALASEGFDLCFLLKDADDRERGEPVFAAVLEDPETGRRMTVSTTEPALQLYTGQYLDGRPGKGAAAYTPFSGLCLEAQHPPDALHRPSFPSIVHGPQSHYRQVTEYAFSAT